MSSLTALKRWSRTSQEVTTTKAAQVWRGFTAYIMGKTRFSAVFITLLHYRVAKVPKNKLGRHLPAHGRITWGYTTMGSGGLCYLMALNSIPTPPLAGVAALASMVQSWMSHMAGIQNDITGRYKNTGIAQWIILRTVCCYALFPRGLVEVRTLNQIVTVPGIKAMSSKHVRYDVFTAFSVCGKRRADMCVILLTCIMLRKSDHHSNERTDLAHTEFHEGV